MGDQEKDHSKKIAHKTRELKAAEGVARARLAVKGLSIQSVDWNNHKGATPMVTGDHAWAPDSFIAMARSFLNAVALSGLVRKSAMLSAVATYGTATSNPSTKSRTKK